MYHHLWIVRQGQTQETAVKLNDASSTNSAAGLLATVVVEASDPKLKAVRSILGDDSALSSKRFLRSDAAVDDVNEERAFTPAGLEQGANVAKSGTSTLAKKVQLGLLDVDVTGKSANVAFSMLKLDKAGANLLSNPQFKAWVDYVASSSAKHPKMAEVSTLVGRYGDEAVAKMLDAAKKVEGSSEMATKLQAAQMRGWVRNGKSADDVFELLKLDDGLESLLTNPSLIILASYVNQFNKLNPGKETTLVSTMMVSYGDEAVAKMLEAAKKVPSTEKLATEMQVAQFNQWLMEGAQPGQIGKMFKLTKGNVATHPDASIWSAYQAFFKAHE